MPKSGTFGNLYGQSTQKEWNPNDLSAIKAFVLFFDRSKRTSMVFQPFRISSLASTRSLKLRVITVMTVNEGPQPDNAVSCCLISTSDVEFMHASGAPSHLRLDVEVELGGD